MRPPLQILIVSSRIETKRSLLQIADGLSVNAYTSPTIERAWEVLMSHPIDIIFCDDRLSDGHYSDFLSIVRSEYGMTRFIVLLSPDDWGECLEAMRLGATEILRPPCHPTDVELILIRAERDADQEEKLHSAASA